MKTNQNIKLLDYDRGDQVKSSEVNDLVLAVTKKLNHLTPANLKSVTTGNFLGKDIKNNLNLPNYCGIILGEEVFDYVDYPLSRLNDNLERTLSKIMEV